jgi:hypothetical protein
MMSKGPLDQGQYDYLEGIERKVRAEGDGLEKSVFAAIDRARREGRPLSNAAVETQAGIIKYAEAMAQVLAEAALASEKVTGDSPYTALTKWLKVIQNRASEIINEKRKEPHTAVRPRIGAPKTIDAETGEE